MLGREMKKNSNKFIRRIKFYPILIKDLNMIYKSQSPIQIKQMNLHLKKDMDHMIQIPSVIKKKKCTIIIVSQSGREWEEA